MLNRPPASMFGRKKVSEPSTPAAVPTEPTRLTDPVEIALRAIQGDGLDWYFAHYGFEVNWRRSHSGLLALRHQQLADILARAGECYDRYIDEVFTPADGEPSQQDDQRYGDQMRALDQEWRAANPPMA